ncbi:RNA polymerase sigma factor [Devosia sp. MSA67]|uniref:RNA polymerase sigma factor n=2 Tax=Devosia sediminis TaxID=2798801 RepID=A0A934MSZ9_9HYPH|nr:RNA polymerase sigma factor [Devosia sediminis]MBJ3786949.1 RNA polymerase sigma factor [Devosia sediminis]
MDAEALTSALVLRAQKGDGTAFAELIEAQYDCIYRTAWRWCGRRDDAEDIAQEVCVKIGQGLARFDGRSAFSSWVYRITLNAVRDWQRAGARRVRHHDAFADVSPSEAEAEQEAVATACELWAAVRSLPEKQRDAVLLVYAEELSHAEAAAIMGIKEATVSFHVFEARKTLRGLL